MFQSSDDLLATCLDNITRYLNKKSSDTSSCLELLKCAFKQTHADDWNKAYIVLSRVTRVFVRSHKLFPLIDNAENFVVASISRFWMSIYHQYDRFESTEYYFSYLKLCVNSEIVDTFRKAETQPIDDPIPDKSDFHNCTADEIMEIVQQVIGDDKRLLLLADLCFRWGLKARDIVTEFPDIFPDKREVYNMIYDLRKSLRINPDLLDCLEKK